MSKFRSPFNTNELWLTQTYHGENASNPNDLSKQCAVDISAVGGTEVYSVTEGVADVVTSTYGGYVSIIPEGANFRILYVHLHEFAVKAGQRIVKGQLIGKIKPMNASHLHLGLKNLNGKAPHPQPMDYFDRGITFNTKYQAIKNIWYSGDTLNWNLFRSLSYNSNNMKIGDNVEFSADTNLRVGSFIPKPDPNSNIKLVIKKGAVGNVIGGPRTADGYQWWDVRFLNDQGWVANPGGVRMVKTTRGVTPTDNTPVSPPEPQGPTECEKQIQTLSFEITGLRDGLRASEDMRVVLVAEVEQFKIDYKELQNKYDTLHVERNRLENEKNEAIRKLQEAGSLVDASAGDMIAELFRRFKKSLDSAA